jgi:hypothetical protein
MPTSMMQVSQPVTHSLGGQTIKQAPGLKSVKKSGGLNIEIVERSICKPEELGIEVVEKIVWQGWEPGREYTKNIVLKNVKVKTQKIKYK